MACLACWWLVDNHLCKDSISVRAACDYNFNWLVPNWYGLEDSYQTTGLVIICCCCCWCFLCICISIKCGHCVSFPLFHGNMAVFCIITARSMPLLDLEILYIWMDYIHFLVVWFLNMDATLAYIYYLCFVCCCLFMYSMKTRFLPVPQVIIICHPHSIYAL